MNDVECRLDDALKANAELDKALFSNKEDTSNALVELGLMFEETQKLKSDIEILEKAYELLKKQNDREWIGIGIASIGSGIGGGVLLDGMLNKNTVEIISGCSVVVVSDLIAFLGWKIGWW